MNNSHRRLLFLCPFTCLEWSSPLWKHIDLWWKKNNCREVWNQTHKKELGDMFLFHKARKKRVRKEDQTMISLPIVWLPLFTRLRFTTSSDNMPFQPHRWYSNKLMFSSHKLCSLIYSSKPGSLYAIMGRKETGVGLVYSVGVMLKSVREWGPIVTAFSRGFGCALGARLGLFCHCRCAFLGRTGHASLESKGSAEAILCEEVVSVFICGIVLLCDEPSTFTSLLWKESRLYRASLEISLKQNMRGDWSSMLWMIYAILNKLFEINPPWPVSET